MKWHEQTYIVLDTETSGPYPLQDELCEFAALQFRGTELISEYHTLIKPNLPMSETVIKIHGITNEMVTGAPPIKEVIKEIYNFVSQGVVVAHHAPFDVGFLASEFEKNSFSLPQKEILCSSLLSRNTFRNSPNHKLQTLISFLNLSQGQAHRALDDAKASWGVLLKVIEKLGGEVSLQDLQKQQVKELSWSKYSLLELRKNPVLSLVLKAIDEKDAVEIMYQGGSQRGKYRVIYPKGVVRNPDGDYVMAHSAGENILKRFYLEKITASR